MANIQAGLPRVQVPEKAPDWSLSSLGANFVAGFADGLLTFTPDFLKADSPDTVEEYVARSLGSVLGFIGWLPTPGALGKLGLTAVGHTMQLVGEAARGEELLTKAVRTTSFATGKFGMFASIPKFVGTLGAKGTERFFESSAAKATMNFADRIAGKDLIAPALTEASRSMASQVAFMGFASAAASRSVIQNPLGFFTSEDFNTRVEGFLGGAVFGAAQGSIANLISERAFQKIGYNGFTSLMSSDPKKAEFFMKSMRAATAGLTMAGYTAYSQDVPIEYTIYEGLLNSYFGWKEPPYTMKEANRLVNKHLNNQNTIHGEFIHKTAGDIIQFMKDKGENPSEGTQKELEIIQSHYWGKNFAQDMWQNISKDRVADLTGVTRDELDAMPQAEVQVLLGRPELEQFKSLQTDVMKMEYDDQMKNRIDNFTKAYNRPPSADEKEEMSTSSYVDAWKVTGDRSPSIAEWIKRTANNVSVAVDLNRSFTEKEKAIDDSLRETGVSRQGMNDLLTILHPEIVKKGLDELNVVNTVGRIFYENKKLGQTQFGNVLEKIEGKLGISTDEKSASQLGVMWNMYANSKTSNEYYYDIDLNQLYTRPMYDKRGIDQLEYRDTYNYEKEFGTDLMTIKEATGNIGRNGARQTVPIFEPWKSWDRDGFLVFNNINTNKLIQSIYDTGYLFIGNKKDNYQLLAEKKGDIVFDPQSSRYSLTHKGTKYSTTIRDSFNNIDIAEGATGSYDAYLEQRMKYVQDNSGKSYSEIDSALKTKFEKAYDDITANRILKIMALNQKANLYDLFSSPGTTIRNAFGINQRNQLVFGGGIPLDPSIVGKDNLTMAQIVIKNNQMVDNFGKQLDTHEDGVMIFFSHMNSIFQQAIGAEASVAFMKPAVAVSLPSGLHIQKEGAHLNTKLHEAALNDALKKVSGIDGVAFKGTAIKQPGDIPTLVLEWKDGKYDVQNELGQSLTDEAIEKSKFQLPVSAFRLNPSVSEDSDMKPLHWIKQMISNTPEIADHIYNTVARPALEGDEATNKHFSELKSGEDINIDKVGAQKILSSLYGEDFHKNSPQFRAVADKLLNYFFDHQDTMDGEEESDVIADMKKLKTAVSLSINGTGKENITPMFARRPEIRDYLEQVAYKYIADRAQRPLYDGFASNSKLFYGLTPPDLAEYEKTSGRKFSQGDYFLGKGLRGMRRDMPKELQDLFPGQKNITLGEIWDKLSERVKLVRVEAKPSGEKLPEWLQDQIKKGEIKEGGWYSIDPSDVEWYKNHTIADGYEPIIKEIFVPKREVEKYKVANLTNDFKKLSRRPETEYFIQKEIRDKFESEQKLLTDWWGRTIVTRSPQSDASGSRRMTMRGFMELPGDGGYGVAVHPLDMKYLDGADMDGDATKIYFGMDRVFADHVDQPHIKHRFSRFFASADDRTAFFNDDNSKGFTISQVLADPNLRPILTTGKDASGKVYNEDFAMEKGYNQNLIGNQDNTNLRHTFSMFTPTLLYEAGRQSTTGKFNLGRGLANGNRGRELMNYLRSTGGKVEIAEGKYYLRAHPDPEHFNRTVWDIVNSSADAAKGKNPPVDYETMRVVGGVLSGSEVLDKNSQPLDEQGTKEFINFIKSKGLRQVPVLRELLDVDNNLRLKDYDGNKRHLQDAFYNLSMAVNKAKNVIGGADLGSVWYRTAQYISQLKYEPTPTDFVNVVNSDIVRRGIDRFIKSDTPSARFLMRGLGRMGLSFNNTYVADTQVYREVIARYKGPRRPLDLLNEFINPPGNNYQNSELWKLAAELPHPTEKNKTINKQSLLQNELTETGLKHLWDASELDPDKRSVTYKLKDGRQKTEYLASENEANKFVQDRTMMGRPAADFQIGRVPRTFGERIKFVQNLYMNDFTDINSLLFVKDHLAKYVEKRLPKEQLTDENVNDLLERDIRPFAEKINGLKDYVRNTQAGIANPRIDEIDPLTGNQGWKSASQREENFRYWEDALQKARDFKSALPPEKRNLFDALWLSSLTFNDRSNEYYDNQANAEYLQKGPVAKDAADEKSIVNSIRQRLIAEDVAKKFDTYRGRTTLTSDIADPEMVKDYFKKWSNLAESMSSDDKNLSMESVGQLLNLGELSKNLPSFLFMNKDFAETYTRPEFDTAVNKNLAPLRQWFLDSFGKDNVGNPKNQTERMEFDALRERARVVFNKMPHELYNFKERFRAIMEEEYGKKYHWDPQLMTKQDFKLYLDNLEGKIAKPGERARVKASWAFMKFDRIANQMEKFQDDLTKTRLRVDAPVLTAEGPKNREPIEYVMGSYAVMNQNHRAYEASKNQDEQLVIDSFRKNVPYFDILDRQYDGLASEMTKIVAAWKIEGPLAREGNLEQKNLDNAIKKFNKLKPPSGNQYLFTDEKGKTLSMDKYQLLQHFTSGIHLYQNDFRNYMYSSPDDNLMVYTGNEWGRNRTKEVDPTKTNKKMLEKSLTVGGLLPRMSIKASTELAAWEMLRTKAFDVYTTPGNNIQFDSQMGKEQREHFDKAIANSVSGYNRELGKRFADMTPAEKDAVMDVMFPNGNIAGFNLNEQYDILGDSYWHHETQNKKTIADYMRRKIAPMIGMSAEELKNYSQNLLRIVRNTTNQQDNLNGGQELMARLFEKSDPIRSMHIHPEEILGLRDKSDPIPDWDLSINAMLSAQRKLLKMQHDMTFAIMSHHLVSETKEKQAFGDGEQTLHLANWMERFARQTMGFQDTTPPEMPEGYNYGLTTNWMKVHQNKFWTNKISQIADSWFGSKIFPDYARVNTLAQHITFKDDTEKKKWINQAKTNLSEMKLSWLSQMEAKWSLVSLLTSFKTAVTNITTAHMMTFINTGMDAYIRSWNFKSMQDEFGKDVLPNRGTVETILKSMGGLEAQFNNEWGMDPGLFKATHSAMTDVITEAGEKDWKDAQIMEKIRGAGLVDAFVNKAAWFMRASERNARGHSMLAHYINARRTFRQAGFDLEYDDPWIMQVAREGVKASQFLYSNGERPEFMSTPMGKIFHRFQLFTYNSVEYRINALKAAQVTGIGPGSDDQKRFDRMAVADLFVFGMASLLPFSMFGSIMMAPYTGLQNSLQYFFGTDDEKKKVFFSPMPYPLNIVQPIVPVGLREIPQLFGFFNPNGTIMQNVENMVVSAAPFQRIGKDIYRTYKNPVSVIDNMTGIPLVGMTKVNAKISAMSTFDDYIREFRSRSSFSKNKKMEQDINQYLDQYPAPELSSMGRIP